METSILQQIKKKVGGFIEPQVLKTGRILDVRVWEPATIIEIDLHLPLADMLQWTEVPYMKVRVGDLCFRKYTPFGWDAETSTCSLLIDITHEGPGSQWAKDLRKGDLIHYSKIEGTHQSPHPTDAVVALGDASSLAHLLALQQLTLPACRFQGAAILDSQHTGELFRDYFCSTVSTLNNREELADWLVKQGYCAAHTWFYLTGNKAMVAGLRDLLKDLGYPNIRVKGFWS